MAHADKRPLGGKKTLSAILDLTGDSFDGAVLLNGTVPTLVDFWAEWCAPCKAQKRIVREVAQHYGQRVQVASINVDEWPQLAQRFQIKSVPTQLIFHHGEIRERRSCVSSRAELVQALDIILGDAAR